MYLPVPSAGVPDSELRAEVILYRLLRTRFSMRREGSSRAKKRIDGAEAAICEKYGIQWVVR